MARYAVVVVKDSQHNSWMLFLYSTLEAGDNTLRASCWLVMESQKRHWCGKASAAQFHRSLYRKHSLVQYPVSISFKLSRAYETLGGPGRRQACDMQWYASNIVKAHNRKQRSAKPKRPRQNRKGQLKRRWINEGNREHHTNALGLVITVMFSSSIE